MAAVRREFYVQMNHLIENENGLETIDCLHMVSFPILLHIHMTLPSTQSFPPDPCVHDPRVFTQKPRNNPLRVFQGDSRGQWYGIYSRNLLTSIRPPGAARPSPDFDCTF